MILSNLITANNLDAKPAIQQTRSTEKIIKLEIPTNFFVPFFAFVGDSTILTTIPNNLTQIGYFIIDTIDPIFSLIQELHVNYCFFSKIIINLKTTSPAIV